MPGERSVASTLSAFSAKTPVKKPVPQPSSTVPPDATLTAEARPHRRARRAAELLVDDAVIAIGDLRPERGMLVDHPEASTT